MSNKLLIGQTEAKPLKPLFRMFYKTNEQCQNMQDTKNVFNAQYDKKLPCRGCTYECKSYKTCSGIPWRDDEPKKPVTAKNDL